MTGVRNIPDPYAALGVESSASADEIKRAYRKLAREYHPDSTGGDKGKEARFKEISSAYGIVGDPAKRAQYDAMRNATARGAPGGIPEGVFDLGDLFAQVFQGAGVGSDGGNATYRVHTAGPGGFSFVDGLDLGGFGFGGARRARAKRPTPAKPPKKRKVRLSDGTLVTARGNHIHSDLRLSIDQAVMGTSSTVPTLDGKATLRVPPGTSSGVKLRLRGKGLKGKSGKRGDHFVTVQIDVPKEISDEARRLLVQFTKAAKETK